VAGRTLFLLWVCVCVCVCVWEDAFLKYSTVCTALKEVGIPQFCTWLMPLNILEDRCKIYVQYLYKL